MPLFTGLGLGLAGLIKGGKAIGGKIVARKGATAGAGKVKKATTTAKKAGATARLSPGSATLFKSRFFGVPGKITGGLKQGAGKVATLKKKGTAKKAGVLGAGVVAGAGVGHHLNRQRRREEQRRQEERQVTTFQVHQQGKEEQRRRKEERRQEQDEIRQDYRRQEEAFADTEQMFADKGKTKSIWRRFLPGFGVLILILLFLFVLSERDRK